MKVRKIFVQVLSFISLIFFSNFVYAIQAELSNGDKISFPATKFTCVFSSHGPAKAAITLAPTGSNPTDDIRLYSRQEISDLRIPLSPSVTATVQKCRCGVDQYFTNEGCKALPSNIPVSECRKFRGGYVDSNEKRTIEITNTTPPQKGISSVISVNCTER